MADAILLVDDDEVFLQAMARSLGRRGQSVHVAGDLETALTLLARERPDKVLLDLNLDGESGLQALPQMLALSPSSTIILLTAYASVATAVEAIKRGAANYLCKPATANDVIDAFAAEMGEVPAPGKEMPESEALEPISIPRLEWEHIQRVLQEHDGNISATARALGMHRRTLQRKLQKRPPK